MKFVLGISRVIDAVTGAVGRFTWWVSLFMVLVGAFNVVTRYAFEFIAGLFGTGVAQALSGNRYLSLQTFSYDIVFMLGAAYVLSKDGHVRVDIVFSRLSAKAKAWVDVFGAVLFLVPFCWLGLYFSRSYVQRSWSQLEASGDPGGIPFYIIKGIIPVMFVMLIAQAVSETIKNGAFLAGVPNSGSVHANHPEPPGQTVAEGAASNGPGGA